MTDDTPIYNMCAAYATLGCKLNFAETSSLRDALARQGVRPAEKGERADICIINTCSVTDVADHKCRQAIHRLTREHPGAFVVVMGCYAQLKPEEIAGFDGVDLVVGMEHKGEVVRYIRERMAQKKSLTEGDACHEAIAVPTREITTFVPSCSRGDRTRYFLKVQDGCNYYCTYCTIPIARGRSRNGSVASLVAQAEAVAHEGGKEIVITGVNIGDFGRSTGETFFDLVKALDQVEGIARYRISSIEPNLLTDEIIDYCASSRAFMPHFHIPLQSGSDDVLRLMHRRYDTALFARKIARVKEVMPDAFIGVDVIVGTRGETDAYFEDAFRFIEGLDISQLHVFSYSERPGTKALEIPHSVDAQTKHARSQRLLALSEQKRKAFYAAHIGQTRPVLWEHAKDGGLLHGFTDNYIRVELSSPQAAADNSLTTVRLGDFTPNGECLLAEEF
ncbi:MAG: tRNA (N(6)-L-threonylcarbamoyladenosine(37)-C(2))-methylthiotransferase MtaB [Bacteroidales bacterium]|nr:tRNA (N(6)-L-threonylcarbamoyladenosine(37)-C(2))-methylthiotransferase MtaB [Bacteroidales bacterium]